MVRKVARAATTIAPMMMPPTTRNVCIGLPLEQNESADDTPSERAQPEQETAVEHHNQKSFKDAEHDSPAREVSADQLDDSAQSERASNDAKCANKNSHICFRLCDCGLFHVFNYPL